MSIEATLATWKLTKEQVTATEKLFLLSCANRAGENNECWPSLRRLIADTGLDRKTLIKIRQSVVDKSLMEYTNVFAGRSNQIPVMRLTYVNHLEDIIEQQFTSTNTGTSTKNGTGTSTVFGMGTSTVFGTLNLKEESKRINISTSCELQNLGYTEFDEQNTKKEKSDYFLPLRKSHENNSQVSEIEVELVKSDYCDNKTNTYTESKSKERYGVKNLLSDNIFQIPEQIITDWVENRKKKRAPITQTAWNKITKELTKCKEQGIEPIEAFETMVASGWQSLKVEYFVTEKDLSAKRDEAKRQSLELEERARRMKQQEIDNAKRFNPIVRKACENERLKLRQAIGSRAPETIVNHRRVN